MTPRRSAGAAEPPHDPAALADATFDALSDARRRHALYYLRDRESTTLDELSTVLAGWLTARADEVRVATPDDRERVRLGLHHADLPRLAAAGLVRYDSDSGAIALADLPEFVERTLDRSLADDRERAGERGPSDATNRRNT